jgi:hypothetical protein
MACTELPIPAGIEKEVVLKSKQTDTTLVNDSTGIDISITVDSSTNKIEHFIKF